MQALESLRAAVSGARAAVSGAVGGGAGGILHSLPILGHLTAADDSRHEVPHLPETGFVGADAICAAAGKRVEDYLGKRSTKAYIRALVKEGTASSEAELIHDHEEAGPFLHPKLALHMAQWCNPAFAAVVNGWVLRFIAADRTLADDIQRRAGSGAGMETLGSSLTHTMRDVPMLPANSQPRDGELDAPMPPAHEVEASAAAGPPASKAPSRRKAPAAASIPPVALEEEEAEEAPLAEEEEVSEEESESGEALPPVKTPATRQPRRARTGGKSTPAAKAKGAKGVAKGGVKRRRKHQESYGVYLHRVLKQIHPELGISSKAVEVMNNMVSDLFESLATEASTLVLKDKARTLSAREVAAAVKLRLKGDLRAHAMSEGAKAVARFNSSAK